MAAEGAEACDVPFPRIARRAAALIAIVALLVSACGGSIQDTIAEAWSAGADTFVAGTAVFGAPDPARAVRDLKRRCAVLA